ncbi:MAG: hypothetical protein U5K69_24990 [Balneolaceae bacterium]|nr:hypothetical protein [Balneolaceae bacterium]
MKANQLSQTAAFIAIKFYRLTRMPPFRSCFDGQVIDFYDEMVEFLPAPLNWYHAALQKSWIRTFFLHSEELLLPGDLMHIICRKYFIGRSVNDLLAEGMNNC